eukprot:gene14258-17867_t
MSLPLMLAAATSAVTAGRPPAVYDDAKFEVQAELGVQYGMGVLCNATTYGEGCGNGSFTEAPYDCSVCQAVEPQTTPPLTPTADCVAPRLFNLTLDMYTPIGVKASLGPRPAIVLTHEGGYSQGTEEGCRLTANPMDPARPGKHMGEMTAACRHFAVRDTKAAIRWLRGNAADYFGAGGWSAGACTTVFLATQYEDDFKHEMDSSTDPTFGSLVPHLNESSAITAGLIWAGNGAVTDTINAFDGGRRWNNSKSSNTSRYNKGNKPLAMYRGSDDSVMSPFTAPNATHSGLFPLPTVQYKNGNLLPRPRPNEGGGGYMTVLNHSYSWIVKVMGLGNASAFL